ncbi:unnamed protein product [Paramecium primaurelia]|uniref:Uncharacterized protein n=1 Tax=Paramecium primaurelia TaxID=5886 RepID=A0A8S1PPE3_PARPR|nr:unnamed protein product [Paramecium primaurelia]
MSESEISFDFNEDDSVEEVKSSQMQNKPERQIIPYSKSDKKDKKEKLKQLQFTMQGQNSSKQQMTKDLLFLLKFEQHMLSSINSLHQRIMRSLENEAPSN